MSPLHHESEQKRFERGKGGEEERRGNELKRTAEDDGTHCHRVEKGKAQCIHVDAIGNPKEKNCEDGDGVGKGGAQGGERNTGRRFHGCLQSQSSACAASTPIACSVE